MQSRPQVVGGVNPASPYECLFNRVKRRPTRGHVRLATHAGYQSGVNGLAHKAAQHVPKILLCLAFCAAALHTAVSHTAKVPLTGRRQLILSLFSSRPFPPKNQSSLPTQVHQVELGLCEPRSNLKDQALQLLVDLYGSVCYGTASLAAHHDDLHQRLLTLPDKLSLTHDMTRLESWARLRVSMTLGPLDILPRAFWPCESGKVWSVDQTIAVLADLPVTAMSQVRLNSIHCKAHG